jgi:hypothetical protein
MWNKPMAPGKDFSFLFSAHNSFQKEKSFLMVFLGSMTAASNKYRETRMAEFIKIRSSTENFRMKIC